MPHSIVLAQANKESKIIRGFHYLARRLMKGTERGRERGKERGEKERESEREG